MKSLYPSADDCYICIIREDLLDSEAFLTKMFLLKSETGMNNILFCWP